jgi:hypothetical protein
MDDDRDQANRDRFKKFESTLDPAVTKFMPKVNTYPTIASLVEQVRAHISGLTELCEQIEVAINASEENAKKAGDALIEMLKRVK